MSSHRPASLSVVLFAAVAPFLWMSGPAVGTPGDRKFPPVAKTVLRVARSADGLTFQDTGEVFMERGPLPMWNSSVVTGSLPFSIRPNKVPIRQG